MIIHHGVYRDDHHSLRQWRIIEKDSIFIEVQAGEDAMGKPSFWPYEMTATPLAILTEMLALVKSKVAYADPRQRPAILFEGQIQHMRAWRMIETMHRGIVCEEESGRDWLGDIVWVGVKVFDNEGSVERAILKHLLGLLGIKGQPDPAGKMTAVCGTAVPKVVAFVEGGVVQNCISNVPNLQVVLVNRDTIYEDKDPEAAEEDALEGTEDCIYNVF